MSGAKSGSSTREWLISAPAIASFGAFLISALILLGYALEIGMPLLNELSISDILNFSITPISVFVLLLLAVFTSYVAANIIPWIVRWVITGILWVISKIWPARKDSSDQSDVAVRKNRERKTTTIISAIYLIYVLALLILFLLSEIFSISGIFSYQFRTHNYFYLILLHFYAPLLVSIVLFASKIYLDIDIISKIPRVLSILIGVFLCTIASLHVGYFIAGDDLANSKGPCRKSIGSEKALCIVRDFDRGYLTYDVVRHRLTFITSAGPEHSPPISVLISPNTDIPVSVRDLSVIHWGSYFVTRWVARIAFYPVDHLTGSHFDKVVGAPEDDRRFLSWELGTLPGDSDLYRRRGWVNYREQRYDEAITDFTRAAEIAPRDNDALYGRGRAFYEKGEFDRAIDDFNKAFAIKEPTATEREDRAAAYSHAKDYDASIADYTAALATSPKREPERMLLAYRAYVFMRKGDFDRAMADYTRAIDLDAELSPKWSYPWIGRCELNRLFAKPADALSDCGQWPNGPAGLAGRGLTHLKEGDLSVALAEFNSALRMATDDDDEFKGRLEALVGREAIYRMKGDQAAADADQQEAQAIDADYAARIEQWIAANVQNPQKSSTRGPTS